MYPPIIPSLPQPVRPLEWQAVTIAAGYGLWLACGQPFGLSLSFRYERMLDEWMWALMLGMGVLVHLLGCALWHRRFRQLGLMLVGLVWLAMSLCVLAANPRMPGVWTHLMLAGSAVYCSIRLQT
jgi:hypothetical protein